MICVEKVDCQGTIRFVLDSQKADMHEVNIVGMCDGENIENG